MGRAAGDAVTQDRLQKLAAEYEAQADARDDEETANTRYGKRGEDY
jgi:hypothetical protein